MIGSTILDQACFDYRRITHLEDYKKNINFSFMQSMVLISAYLAGHNKERMDGKVFSREKQKIKHVKSRVEKNPGQCLIGKTKKFGIERLCAIIDYLVSL